MQPFFQPGSLWQQQYWQQYQRQSWAALASWSVPGPGRQQSWEAASSWAATQQHAWAVLHGHYYYQCCAATEFGGVPQVETLEWEGMRSVITPGMGSPNIRSELSRGTANLECDVPEKLFPSSRRTAPHCGEYGMEPQGGLLPRMSAESAEYDPCNPIFVSPATELEKADADLADLRQQLARMKPMVARRSRMEPHSPVVRDYQRKVREMESELERAEARRASIASAFFDSDFQAVSDHRRRGESHCSTKQASVPSVFDAEESLCSTCEASLRSDFGAEEVSAVPSLAIMA